MNKNDYLCHLEHLLSLPLPITWTNFIATTGYQSYGLFANTESKGF